MAEQAPSELIMVRPKHFKFDAETAQSNAFQHESDLTSSESQSKALKEFENSVAKFESVGVKVKVFNDLDGPIETPDSIFPNNWFSTHANGIIFIYPMLCEARRHERRTDVIDHLIKFYQVKEIIDLSHNERNGNILEGTGSIVFDHLTRTAYACRSPRTCRTLLATICQKIGYKPIMFDAVDKDGKLIYHTNVMMWVGTDAVAVCLDSISDQKERDYVLENLKVGSREIVDLSWEETANFGGNCLEVVNGKGNRFLAISQQAVDSLSEVKLGKLKRSFNDLLVCDVGTIEFIGGGGVRCMMAGIHLEKKDRK